MEYHPRFKLPEIGDHSLQERISLRERIRLVVRGRRIRNKWTCFLPSIKLSTRPLNPIPGSSLFQSHHSARISGFWMDINWLDHSICWLCADHTRLRYNVPKTWMLWILCYEWQTSSKSNVCDLQEFPGYSLLIATVRWRLWIRLCQSRFQVRRSFT